MLVLILMWWAFVQLSAPTWCFGCLAFAMFLKCLCGLADIIKTIVEIYDKSQDKKNR